MTGHTGHCHSCLWETDALREFTAAPSGVGPSLWLCDICARSIAGSAFVHHDVHDRSVRQTTAMIAWGLNYLTDLLRKAEDR